MQPWFYNRIRSNGTSLFTRLAIFLAFLVVMVPSRGGAGWFNGIAGVDSISARSDSTESRLKRANRPDSLSGLQEISSPRLKRIDRQAIDSTAARLGIPTPRLFEPAPPESVAVQDTTALVVVAQSADTMTVTADSVGAREAHPQDSPVDRGFLIRTADGSAELRIRGSVRLNGIIDFNGLQSQSTFNTYDIPVGDANIDQLRYQMNASQTRLAVEATRKADKSDIFVKVETDFLGTSNNLRIRHAYASLYHFLFGQTWSTFADVTAIPLTVDLDGPNGSVSERTVQIRYSGDFTQGLSWDVSIESPSIGATIPDSITWGPTFQSFPDFIGRVRDWGDWGHVQVAGVLRSIASTSAAGGKTSKVGYGVLLSGRIVLGGSIPHRIMFQVVGGRAISRYIGTLSKKGLDLVFNPVTGEIDLVDSFGGYLSYARQWTPRLLSYFTVGFVRIRNVEEQPDNAFRFSRYVSGNIFWNAAPGTRVGLEYSWGLRVNKDMEQGVANRISFILIYDF